MSWDCEMRSGWGRRGFDFSGYILWGVMLRERFSESVDFVALHLMM